MSQSTAAGPDRDEAEKVEPPAAGVDAEVVGRSVTSASSHCVSLHSRQP